MCIYLISFEQGIWSDNVLEIAFEAVYQKFSQLFREKVLLLATRQALICEASPSDHMWGIGVATDQEAVIQDPKLWRGTNILGWALMEARSAIVADQAAGTVVGLNKVNSRQAAAKNDKKQKGKGKSK
jgi:ribA/ribD-fused uncharacterized protein